MVMLATLAPQPARGLPALVEQFLALAATLEPYAPPAAVAYREAARLLAEALDREANEVLTPEQAAEESGYSLDQVRRWRREGPVPFTADGSILRRHLPRKPGHGVTVDDLRSATATPIASRTLLGGLAGSGGPLTPSRGELARSVIARGNSDG